MLNLLPQDRLFDGELVVLDDAACPLFNELLFGRCRPTYYYVAFDLRIADSLDLRPLPLKHRKATLVRTGGRAKLAGEGRVVYGAVGR